MFLQDLVAAAALLEKLRKEAEASRQLAEKAAAALTYGVDRLADRAHAADIVNRLVQLQNVRPPKLPCSALMMLVASASRCPLCRSGMLPSAVAATQCCKFAKDTAAHGCYPASGLNHRTFDLQSTAPYT